MSEEQKTPELQAQPAVMTAQIQITRAKTGKVEDYTLIFTPVKEEPKQEG